MKAMVLEQPGPQPVLRLRHLPEPEAGPGEAVVQVQAVGVCGHDLLVATGRLRRGVKDALVLGHEVAGRVVRVGEGVAALREGDQVVALGVNACGACPRCLAGWEHRCLFGLGLGHGMDGGFAQYVKLREHALVPVPPALPPVQACLLACPIGVALHAARDVARLRRGEAVLVTGAGGGLGVHATQVCRLLRARVLALTSSPGRAARLRALGVRDVLVSGEVDLAEEVAALTYDHGADVVLDTVGAPLFPATLRVLARGGRLVVAGDVTGEPVALRLAELVLRDAAVLGAAGCGRRHVEQAAGWVAEGRLGVVVDRVLPLEEAATALELLHRREVVGRVVLAVE